MSDDLSKDMLARLNRLEMFAGHVADWAGNALLHIKARAMLEATAHDVAKPTPAEHANGAYDPDCAACREYAEPSPSDDIAKRMEALIKRIADDEHFSDSAEARAVTREARAIVALLTEPVDPDLAFAREIIADAVSYGEQSVRQPEAKTSRDFRSGECDAGDLIARVVKQLRTRALERDSREG